MESTGKYARCKFLEPVWSTTQCMGCSTTTLPMGCAKPGSTAGRRVERTKPGSTTTNSWLGTKPGSTTGRRVGRTKPGSTTTNSGLGTNAGTAPNKLQR